MKLLKTALILSALGAMLSFTGCTARDSNASSSVPPSAGSPSSSLSSREDSVPPVTSDEDLTSSSQSSRDETTSSEAGSGSSSLVPTLSTDFSEIGALDGQPVTWGPGRDMDENNRPTACLGLQERYGKYNCKFIGDQAGKIYLTFDEGYENGYTAQILDVLKEKEVKAVFFVTGHYAKSQPELVRRMIDEGHMVGNHSYSHPQGDTGFNSMPLDAIQSDIAKLQDYVKETFDYDMTLFRFPEGTFTERNVALMDQMGFRTLFWSFAYSDWDRDNQPNPQAARDKIVGAAHDGAIYLLHAVSSTNAQILPDVIDALQEKGYEFALFE